MESFKSDASYINQIPLSVQESDNAFLQIPGNKENLIALIKLCWCYDKDNDISLPEVEDGTEIDWLEFSRTYKNSCHNYSKMGNLLRIYSNIDFNLLEILIYSNNTSEPEEVMRKIETIRGTPSELIPYIEQLNQLPKATNDLRNISKFSKSVIEIIDSIKTLNNVDYLNNKSAGNIIIKKMTYLLKKKWEEKNDIEKIKDEDQYIKRRKIEINNTTSDLNLTEETDAYFPVLIKLKNFLSYTICICERFNLYELIDNNLITDFECHVCSGKHNVVYCYGFHTEDYNFRLDIVRKKRLCQHCLQNILYHKCGKSDIHSVDKHFLLNNFSQLEKDIIIKDKTNWRTIKSPSTKNGLLQILEMFVEKGLCSKSYIDKKYFNCDKKEWLWFRDDYNVNNLSTTFQSLGRICFMISGKAKEILISCLDKGIVNPQVIMQEFYENIGKPSLNEIVLEIINEIPNPSNSVLDQQSFICNVLNAISRIKDNTDELLNMSVIDCVIQKMTPEMKTKWNEFIQIENKINLNCLYNHLKKDCWGS